MGTQKRKSKRRQGPKAAYIAARLVKACDRWYITYQQTNPATGLRERYRNTHQLGHIDDEKQRETIAKAIIDEINAKLHTGWPFLNVEPMSISKAVGIAADIKGTSDRYNSRKTTKSMASIFLEYAASIGRDTSRVTEWGPVDCQRYLDYLQVTRKVTNTTLNNHLTYMRGFWTTLIARKYAEINPWEQVEKKKAEAKQRRAFSDHEKTVVFAAIEQEDRVLALAVALLYFCSVRISEMLRLKYRMFNLKEGLIYMSGDVTKNRYDDIVTIPEEVLPWLQRELQSTHPNWLIFGQNLKPHPTKPAGQSSLNRRHSKILQDLLRRKALPSIEGLSLYSWKDTGAMDLVRQGIDIMAIMKHLRHKDLSTTQVYCESLYVVNHPIRYARNSLFKPRGQDPK